MDENSITSREDIVYSLERSEWLGGWWAWACLVIVVAAALFFIVRLYRRDALELSKATRVLLTSLRILVVFGLVIFFLSPERRARQRVVRPSEVAVLVDTSQSMALPQGDSAGGQKRIEAVRQWLVDTPLLEQFAQQHRVSVYSFDATGELNEVVVVQNSDDEDSASLQGLVANERGALSPVGLFSAVVLAFGLLGISAASFMHLVGRGPAAAPWLTAATWIAILGGGFLASVWTIRTEATIGQVLGLESIGGVSSQQGDQPTQPDSNEEQEPSLTPREKLDQVDWDSVLVAAGPESRIGDALRSLLIRHDPSTLAGVLVMTDGQNNAGVPPVAVAGLAAREGTAIYPLGFGSSRSPVNVRIVDVDAPTRVYPGDKFAVGAVLQASGDRELKVQIQLLDRLDSEQGAGGEGSPDGANDSDLGELIDSQEVTLKGDGTLAGVRFEIEPASVGRRKLTLRVVAPPEDQNSEDNQRQARYEVVSRRLRVLLAAGGPMREYRFVRNLLFRDPSVEVDVLLQTGQAGISQDADRILRDFPSTPEELFQYDAIIAFDPDWTAFRAEQVELLDTWLSQQAGGLVLVSGPVFLPQWMGQRTDPRIASIRNLFPVVLPTRGALLSSGRVGGETAWPLKFAPDAGRAEFLSLGDSSQQSYDIWGQFSGVYDYIGVKEAKPGAKVYAYFSDPSTAIDEALPIYFASQFYGAGRVFYQGSGEMWRIRGISDAYFDTFYTKLIRWVSEGRLLRDSNRGVLLVERPRAQVGDTIAVRAILTDEQYQPLRVPQVEAKVLTPSGKIESLRLAPVQGEPREGTYSGRLLVREAGNFEIRVSLGDALGEQTLRQTIQVSLPTLELERPQRNDEMLAAMANSGGGRFFRMDQFDSSNPGMKSSENAASNENAATSENALALLEEIEPQPQLTILPGTPDQKFRERRNASLMWLICALFSMEWVVRRLNRLA